jgi:hypothetical protein
MMNCLAQSKAREIYWPIIFCLFISSFFELKGELILKIEVELEYSFGKFIFEAKLLVCEPRLG